MEGIVSSHPPIICGGFATAYHIFIAVQTLGQRRQRQEDVAMILDVVLMCEKEDSMRCVGRDAVDCMFSDASLEGPRKSLGETSR